MYSSKFILSKEINDNIVEIESIKNSILKSLINPKIDIAMKRKAIIQSVYASTTINDVDNLRFDDVQRLINGLNRSLRDKKEKKAFNYYKVLKNINEYHKNGKVTEKLLLKMHKDITKDLLDNPVDEGHYRNINNKITNIRTGEIRYIPPNPDDVPKLMRELIEWINKDSNKMSPVITAGIVHYEITRIHPFVNGNGRTARALATLILCFRSFDIKGYFALDEQYNLDKKAYVDALKSADDSGDLTEWLEYFTECFLISVAEVIKMISGLPKIVDDPTDFTVSQIQIIRHISENGKITNKQTREMFDISAQAAYKSLKGLEKMEIIKMVYEGASTHYILNYVDENLKND